MLLKQTVCNCCYQYKKTRMF